MKIYNTAKKMKEKLNIAKGGKIKMYMCGPTVYNLIHIGNARPQIVFDTLRRYLTYKGYDVEFIQNFTDIDDKIINKAADDGVPASEIANKYIEEAFKDADALNIKRADFYPRVTEEMDSIIDMVKTLQAKNYAYEINGTVYFDTSKANGYGKLSGKNIEGLESGARIAVDAEKHNVSDFVLWKPAKPGEPFWESPWGNGRPGWHIECSAMAKKYLGDTIDIHCGGEDLMFPHHENEIAQSEAANGAPFARYWLHNAMIFVGEDKMSKSLGNFFVLREAAEKYSYEIIRFFILSAHYRSPLNFSGTLLQSAKNSYERILNCINSLKHEIPSAETGNAASEQQYVSELPRFREMFLSEMDDDFNTANAVTVIFELVKFINTHNIKSSAKIFLDEILFLGGLLGIKFESGISVDEGLINKLIEKRQAARKNKDFAEADRIRNELLEMGIEIKDTREGVKWNIKN